MNARENSSDRQPKTTGRLCESGVLRGGGAMPATLSGPGPIFFAMASCVELFHRFWRAAAIVLSDLATSTYYAGGIAPRQPSANPHRGFILGIMLFGFAIRAIYIESCSMFVRGGVYKIVHEALGGRPGKIFSRGADVRLRIDGDHQWH